MVHQAPLEGPSSINDAPQHQTFVSLGIYHRIKNLEVSAWRRVDDLPCRLIKDIEDRTLCLLSHAMTRLLMIKSLRELWSWDLHKSRIGPTVSKTFLITRSDAPTSGNRSRGQGRAFI